MSELLFTINWLTITTPFIAAFAVYSMGEDSNNGKAVPALLGLLAFLGLIFIWYLLYQAIEFPLWMKWFN